MNSLLFLILFPALPALLLYLFKPDVFRDWIVRICALVIGAASIYLLTVTFQGKASYFSLDSRFVDQLILYLDLGLSVLMIYLGIKYKKFLVPLLAVLQAGLTLWFEQDYGQSILVSHNLFLDQLSLIMAVIVGIIGSLICVYALGYMKDFRLHHPEEQDRRNFFFFLLFIFLSAMFGIVFSNNLIWLSFFWEVTTFCSFLLIGFTKTPEAITNSFNALILNLLGGLALSVGIAYVGMNMGIVELDKLIAYGAANPSATVIPAVLFGFAGIVKAAQLPFSSWLLGAMVAQTPTSALLHSSTMVKAGVYLILRFAPLFGFNLAGTLIMTIGGFTFMVASFAAISQSNAKKVLAYSTVANLGLIVACGGLGSYEAVWAGILLIIFHAIAKSLLFLCVGKVEHIIGSRDIEDMDGLIVRLPQIAAMMVIGMAGMFLAPFGMLISKWAVLKAFVDSRNIVLVIFLAFGSAATFFFWTKWMGKIMAVRSNGFHKEQQVHLDEWLALVPLAAGTILICFLFPFISHGLIEPYLNSVYGKGLISLSQGNLRIMSLMLGMLVILPVGMLFPHKEVKIVPVYLSGANVGDNLKFADAMGGSRDLSLRNYYMEDYFGEKRLLPFGVLLSTSLLVYAFAVIIGGLI